MGVGRGGRGGGGARKLHALLNFDSLQFLKRRRPFKT